MSRILLAMVLAVGVWLPQSAQGADFTNHLGMHFVTIPVGPFFMGSCKLTDAQKKENERRAFLGMAKITVSCDSGAGIDSDADDDETPQYRVWIGRSFQLGVHEVTLGQFKPFLRTQPALVTDDFMKSNQYGDDVPVVDVSWHDAKAFIDWLNRTKPASDRGRYRLPSEAEWEYAARAGTTSRYWWGEEVGLGHANCDGCGSRWDDSRPAPVGSFQANLFGLYDTAGNVREWVEDCWHDNYEGAPNNGSVWKTNCSSSSRVLRGGSWDSLPGYVRSAFRNSGTPVFRFNYIGFRLARTVTP